MAQIRPSGGYRDTCSFQTATIIYDATYWFCEKYLNQRSRTVDQMVQAARSGRQNIAEGSRAAATSSQTELRLINVARSSLEKLLLDYEDFLRHRHLPKWEPDSPEALAVRQVPRKFRQQQQAARLAKQTPPADSPDRSDRSDPSNPPDHDHEKHIPKCPQCGSLMTLRTAQSGKNAGSQFWGCTAYPNCKGIVRL